MEPNDMKILFMDCDAQLAAAWAKVYRADDPPIDVNMTVFERDRLPDIVAGYPICINDHSYFPEPILRRCTDLKHIVFLGTGAASYVDLQAAERLGIGVSTIKGYGDTAVAEHTIALMMAAAREVATMDREIRAGTWQPREGAQLRGKTLGLIGLGGIGQEVARIAAGIGMKIIAWNRTHRDHSGVEMTSLDDVLARADILSMHLTLGDETRDFLGAERLSRTKKGVILVNTARGAVIDETALIDALRSGQIRHAALDVFHDEPLPANHKLAKLANVTLTAHAGFSTPDSLMTLLRRAIDLARGVTESDLARGVIEQGKSR
jgi:D-3-phosphoglycerate dehydrogenase / 2-oxoglutarate reductase